MYSDRWLPDLRGEHIVRYVSVEPLYCTPVTNRILYLNYKWNKCKK